MINHTVAGVFQFSLKEILAEYTNLNFGRQEKHTGKANKRSRSSSGSGGIGLPDTRGSIHFQHQLFLRPEGKYDIYSMEIHGIESQHRSLRRQTKGLRSKTWYA